MIKKILLTLIILLFICGCVESPAQQPEQKDSGVELGEGTLDIDKEGAPQTDTFTISKGSFITFDKKKLTFKELNFRNEMILDVDGKEMVFYQTRFKEIFQGLEITPEEFHFDHMDEDTHVVLKINKFKLEENQYLVYINQEVNIPNKGKVILKDVLTDNMKSINVRVSNEKGLKDEKVYKGETMEILGVKVTNIYPSPRPIGYEKYALIKIE